MLYFFLNTFERIPVFIFRKIVYLEHGLVLRKKYMVNIHLYFARVIKVCLFVRDNVHIQSNYLSCACGVCGVLFAVAARTTRHQYCGSCNNGCKQTCEQSLDFHAVRFLPKVMNYAYMSGKFHICGKTRITIPYNCTPITK